MWRKAKGNKRGAEEPAFEKDALLRSDRYMHRRDLLGALLETGRPYAFSEVDALIDIFMKGKGNQ